MKTLFTTLFLGIALAVSAQDFKIKSINSIKAEGTVSIKNDSIKMVSYNTETKFKVARKGNDTYIAELSPESQLIYNFRKLQNGNWTMEYLTKTGGTTVTVTYLLKEIN